MAEDSMISLYRKALEDSKAGLASLSRQGVDINDKPGLLRGVFVETEEEYRDLLKATADYCSVSNDWVRETFDHETAHGRATLELCGSTNVNIRYGVFYTQEGDNWTLTPNTSTELRNGYKISPRNDMLITKAPKDPSPSDIEHMCRLIDCRFSGDGLSQIS